MCVATIDCVFVPRRSPSTFEWTRGRVDTVARARRALTELKDDMETQSGTIKDVVRQREANEAARHNELKAQQVNMQAALAASMDRLGDRLLQGFGTLFEKMQRHGRDV